ncbi:hypothetical protein B0I35DRAFT_409931 [Stachybotrys elegans]|uniref:Uncharacterized protein n=1 Tax=Stachybotrys elegans TaxID=80388 RepID=A0A8K0SR14_9HYPO|nr:hypothetical protein B0I35DRAFT_409931 [Stachybotrys elegans]
MGQPKDDCFPEFLARDLELSKAVFAARNMTAGAPAPFIASEDHKAAMRNSLCYSRAASPMAYHSASARIQSLGAIQERTSMVSFVDHTGAVYSEPEADAESLSEPYTGLMGTPSISFRQPSFTAAATSLPEDGRRHSPRSSPRPPTTTEASWMDGDSDDDMREEPANSEKLGCLSPRPPTRQDFGASPKPNCTKTREPGPSHHKSCSTGCVGPTVPRSRSCSHVEEPPSIAARSSSLRVDRHNSISEPSLITSPMPLSPLQLHPVHIAGAQLDPTSHVSFRPSVTKNTVTGPGNLTVVTEPSPVSETYSEEEHVRFRPNPSTRPRPDTIYIQPSPPPSPLPSVQTWLCKSTQPYASQLPTDELAKAVPLPPDVIETLRVSIACFPETMLLTSSLTIETIRAYSRKVRQPSPGSTAASIAPTTHNSRRSIWKKVVSYRRGSISPERRMKDSPASGMGGTLTSPSSSSLEALKPWQSIQNVFSGATDYICDALYAHIVAYNYISSLLPRPKPVSKAIPRRHSCGMPGAQQQDIPKKAASVLGLPVGAEGSIGGYVKSFGNHLVSSMLHRDDAASSQASTAASYENAIRDLEMGLMRCIARLVATARSGAEGGKTEDRLIEVDAKEVDVPLIRSLCEIVRLGEDAAVVA